MRTALNLLTIAKCDKAPEFKINPETGEPRSVEKRNDGGGLCLLIRIYKDEAGKETVTRLWQFNYCRPNQLNDKGRKVQNTLGFGVYNPAGGGVSLDDARELRDAARKLIKAGIDPGQQRQQTVVVQAAAGRTFELESADFFKTQLVGKDLRASTLRRYTYMKAELDAKFGKRPIGSITVDEVRTYLQLVIDGDVRDKAERLRNLMRRIFERAVKQRRCEFNPLVALDDEWKKPVAIPYPFFKDPSRVGQLLRDIRNYKENVLAIEAVEMMALTFPRPANVAEMEWKEINEDTATWTIPGRKMKGDREHRVPLSKQALAILARLRPLTGGTKFVFTVTNRPLPYDAMLRCIKSTGICTKTEHNMHGFRKVASTLLHEEIRWYPPAIEMQLAHAKAKGETKVGKIYNAAEYWDIRVQMMSAWGDRVQRMKEGRDGGNVVPLVKVA